MLAADWLSTAKLRAGLGHCTIGREIIVLDEGKVAAIGRHTELLRTSALYRRLVANGLDLAPDSPARPITGAP